MTSPGKYLRSLLVVAVLAAVVAYAAWPRSASAACGSTASSCQDCHEAKKQAPVNTTGDWHTAHAFGDFCEFCHGGNVKATDKAAAHVGLVDPLSDVKSSCQSCHPNDFADRAQKYATTLGKTVGLGGATGTSGTSGATATTPDSSAPCAPAAPAGSASIDLNKVYAETKAGPSSNLGNIILGLLTAGMASLLVGLVWHYDHPLERLVRGYRRVLATPVPDPATDASSGDSLPSELALRPELSSLLPLLRSADPSTTRALTRLLSDPENGPRVIRALSNLDPRSLAALGDGDQSALAALLALSRELKAED